MRVSHETIYQSLFVQARGTLRKELTAYLRTGRIRRKPHGRDVQRGRMCDMTMIADRPPEASDRAVPGHWEGDLIIGKNGRSAIGTLVERRSRFHPGRAGDGGQRAQLSASTKPRLDETMRSLRAGCCIHRLRLPPQNRPYEVALRDVDEAED